VHRVMLGVWIALTSFANAAQAADAGALQISIQSQRLDAIAIEILLDPAKLKFAKIVEGGLTFTKVVLPEARGMATAGTPDVPVLHQLLAVAPGRDYDVQVGLTGRTIMDNVLLTPAQADRLEGGSRSPFLYAAQSYEKDREIGSETVTLGRPMHLGSIAVLPLNFWPIHYNPARRQLTLWRHLTVRLRVRTPASLVGGPPLPLTPFEIAQLRGLVANAPQAIASAKTAANPRLLVLTTSDLLPQAKALATNGRLPEVTFEFQTVAGGSTSANIQDMIAASYARGELNSVLLFGDQTRIPTYSWPDGRLGDSHYAVLDAGSSYMSVGLGRLPVANVAEAQIIVAKLLKYDQLQRRGYRQGGVLLVAHPDTADAHYSTNQESVRTSENPRGFRFTTEYGGAGATNQTVLDAVNKDGYALVAYRGHGLDTHWWEWDAAGKDFGATEVASLVNDDEKMTVVFNIACDTGALQNPAYMAHDLLFLSGKSGQSRGAVAVLAATFNTYSAANDRYNRYLFQALQDQPAADLGSVVGVARNLLVKDGDDAASSNAEMYILFGDPMVRPWLP